MARKTLNSRHAAEDGKRLLRENKRAVLENLCKCIHSRVQKNNGRMPHGYMKTLLEENKNDFNWLTRDIVNSAYCRYKKRLKLHSEHQQPVDEIRLIDQQKLSTSMSDLSESQQKSTGTSCREKGGRPCGSTNMNKRDKRESAIAMKNDIAAEYLNVKKRKKRRISKGVLEEIIQKHQKKRGLEDVPVNKSLIRQRVLRKQPVVNHDHHGGLQSPLVAMDEAVVKIVLVMARIRQCLCPSKGLALVNALIDNQPIQENLIQWKRKYTSNDTGTVGVKY